MTKTALLPAYRRGESPRAYGARCYWAGLAAGRAEVQKQWEEEEGFTSYHVAVKTPPASPPPDPERTHGPAYTMRRTEREIRAKVKALGGTAYRRRGAQLLQVRVSPWRVDFNVPLGLLTGRHGHPGTIFTESNRDLDAHPWYRQMMDVFYVPL